MNNYKACDAASEENLGAESKATFYLLKMRDYFQDESEEGHWSLQLDTDSSKE